MVIKNFFVFNLCYLQFIGLGAAFGMGLDVVESMLTGQSELLFLNNEFSYGSEMYLVLFLHQGIVAGVSTQHKKKKLIPPNCLVII